VTQLRHAGGLLAWDPQTLGSDDQILRAALECFLEKGYHGTSIRTIAARAGLSVPGIYHHFPSKAALLERLIDDTMDDLVALTEEALAAAGADPLDRFDAVVMTHVRFHCERPEESFIGNSELRSLPSATRRRMIAKRDRQQHMFDEVVEAGARANIFEVPLPREASRALVTMCTAVATWYRRDGKYQPAEIVAIYRDLARSMMRCGLRMELAGTSESQTA
jgi:AcrR family transcriptional regulator